MKEIVMHDPDLPMRAHIEKTNPPDGNKYKLTFHYKKDGTDHDLERLLEFSFTLRKGDKACSRDCNPPGPDCDPPDVIPELGTATISDPATPIPGSKIVFRLQEARKPDTVGSCKIFSFPVVRLAEGANSTAQSS
jgi:hypothetical protein